ncbi:gamma-glutamyltransferase family protein [Rhodococcus koreensis]
MEPYRPAESHQPTLRSITTIGEAPEPWAERRNAQQLVARTPATGVAGVAAAAREASTNAALELLELGGNAVDAAVACALVAGVVEPTETSLGGSGFMLITDPTSGRDWSVEFPARAPHAARPDMFTLDKPDNGKQRLVALSAVADDANLEGPLACGVPATLAGLLAAHSRFGRMPRSAVFSPAIALAFDGFGVDSYHALQTLAALPTLSRFSDASRIFLNENGLPDVPPFHGKSSLGIEPVLKQTDLGALLERVADQGRSAFYDGPTAALVEDFMADIGGILTAEDLRAYHPIVREPLRMSYRGWDLMAPGSPCGAWTELQTLAILESFDIGSLGDETLHVFVQASRHAFADRYHWLADPDFVDVPLATLLGQTYARELATQIRNGRDVHWTTPGDLPPWAEFAGRAEHNLAPIAPGTALQHAGVPEGMLYPDHGTTHLSVIDRDGMGVSCTHTAANAFGNKVVIPGTGILLDSAMAWFNAAPGAANSIAPGKRPLANMGPIIARERGSNSMVAVGAPGGRRITSAVTQVLSNVIDHKMNIHTAINAPRIDASGTEILMSERISADVRDDMTRRGYHVNVVEQQHQPFSYEFARPVACAEKDGKRFAAADPFTIASGKAQ